MDSFACLVVHLVSMYFIKSFFRDCEPSILFFYIIAYLRNSYGEHSLIYCRSRHTMHVPSTFF